MISNENKRIESSRLPLPSWFHPLLIAAYQRMKEKPGTFNDVQIISWDKILNTYRIKIYPDITSNKNENLKVKMWMDVYPVIPTLAISCPLLTA